jgi:hypothetical protein
MQNEEIKDMKRKQILTFANLVKLVSVITNMKIEIVLT